MRVRIAAAVVAFAALAAACGGSASSSRASPGSPAALPRCEPEGLVSIGETIPLDCSFENLAGGTLALRELRGKPTVLNFWASWCTFCIREMPDFQRVFADLGDRVNFVGADLLDVQGETRAAARRFARSTGVTYTLIYDTGGLLYGHFSARLLMPTTVFVDAKGIARYRRFGPLTEREIRDVLAQKLGVT